MNVDSVVRTLLGRGLITEAFTDSETGAIHYETTDLLLDPARHQLDRRAAARSRRCSTDGMDGFEDDRRCAMTDERSDAVDASTEGERLQKVLAAAGVASRRVARAVIVDGPRDA